MGAERRLEVRIYAPLPINMVRDWTIKSRFKFADGGRDPYVRSVVNMLEVEERLGIKATWLFKAGGRDKRDITYSLESARAIRVLGMIRERGHDIGLHPSFHAHTDLAMLEREKRRLLSAAGTDLRRRIKARYHSRIEWCGSRSISAQLSRDRSKVSMA